MHYAGVQGSKYNDMTTAKQPAVIDRHTSCSYSYYGIFMVISRSPMVPLLEAEKSPIHPQNYSVALHLHQKYSSVLIVFINMRADKGITKGQASFLFRICDVINYMQEQRKN